jgi:hypothetical protein
MRAGGREDAAKMGGLRHADLWGSNLTSINLRL